MICKVSCSFGEIIDKVTILKIKLKHANSQSNNKLAKINLNNELNAIYQDVPKATTNDDLFNLLFDINQQLWDLEDNIRLKSKNKEFDQKIMIDQKTMLINSFKENLRSNKYWLSLMEYNDQHNQNLERFMNIELIIKSITAQDISRLAKKYLDDKYFRDIQLTSE